MPSAVAKVALGEAGASQAAAEADMLDRLGPAARQAGAEVPRPLAVGAIGGRSVLLQTALSGRRLAEVLGARPGLLPTVWGRLTDWLIRWNDFTARPTPLNDEILRRELLDPIARLAPHLELSGEYRAWIEQRCLEVRGQSVPLVAAHGDLTMWNVLLERMGPLRVLDWATARERALPLGDFLYSVSDAATASRGYADRLAAVEACFAPGGEFAQAVAHLRTRLEHTIALPAVVAELCFHACWLQHAANELQAAGPSDPRPFLRVARWLVTQRSSVAAWWAA
jgi:hypothetical protein